MKTGRRLFVRFSLFCFSVVFTSVEQETVGSKRGQERKAQVVQALHDWLPAWARIFISRQDIDDLIELAVETMKQLLAPHAEQEAGR